MNTALKSDLMNTPIGVLLDHVWPENIPLTKDSGRWMAHEDDTQDADVVFQQEINEEFSVFIRRALQSIIENEEPDEQGFVTYSVDLAIAHADWKRNN